MLFAIDHRPAKQEMLQALLVAEKACSVAPANTMRRVALETLLSEIETFTAAVDQPMMRPELMHLFVASGNRGRHAAKLVAVIEDFRLRLWVRILLSPIVLPLRLLGAAFRMGTRP